LSVVDVCWAGSIVFVGLSGQPEFTEFLGDVWIELLDMFRRQLVDANGMFISASVFASRRMASWMGDRFMKKSSARRATSRMDLAMNRL